MLMFIFLNIFFMMHIFWLIKVRKGYILIRKSLQNCHLMFSSWTFDGSKLMLSLHNESTGNLQYYIENTEWKLLHFFHELTLKTYPCCPIPYMGIIFHFKIERNFEYYTLNLFVPSLLITIVTMVGFFIPYSSTGENTEKVSLGVTALLSLAM